METTPDERVALSVIIPVRDQELPLRRCLDALALAGEVPGGFEVLVIDNGSRASIESTVAAYPFARLLHETRVGSYAARNRGLQDALGDIHAFTDADCVPSVDWLARGLAAVRSHDDGVAVVAGKVRVFARDPEAPNQIERYELATAFPQQEYVRAGYGVTANLFVARAVFDAVGPFDAALVSGGDLEWGQRARAAGFPVHYADDAVVSHPARRTWDSLRAKKRRVIDGEWQRTRGSSKGRWRWRAKLLWSLLPPVRGITSIWHRRQAADAAGGVGGVVGVAIRAHYTQALRRWSLSLGSGRPESGDHGPSGARQASDSF